jgi:glycosyltransferase involved in cell wall biosynthesis
MSVHFSIVVPTRNRPESLRRCVESMRQLDYSVGAWEVIMVNDGGGALSISDLLGDTAIRIIDISHSGPATARNTGARAARGEFLVFTDDDCEVTPNWLNQYKRAFEVHPCAGIGGTWVNPYPRNLAASTWQFYSEYLYRAMRDDAGNALLLFTNNVAYRREVFWQLGGFNESFPLAAAEDWEFGHRLTAHGYTQCVVPEIKVRHHHKTTAFGFLRQHFRYGRGSHYFYGNVQNATSGRVAWKIRFYRNLIAELAARHAPVGMWILLGIRPFVYGIGKLYERWQTSYTVQTSR